MNTTPKNEVIRIKREILIILKYDPAALAEFDRGHFLRAANLLLLPAAHSVAARLKEFSRMLKKLRREVLREELAPARRNHLRLVEHARYARRKAAGALPGVNPAKPAVQKTVGGATREEIRAARAAAKAEKAAAKAERRKLQPAACKAAAHAIRTTPQYRRMNAAYMRWYTHRTPERRAEYEAAREVWRVELKGVRAVGIIAKNAVYKED